MIYGIGTDIAKVSRFKKWISKPDLINRFFNEAEIIADVSENTMMEYYASRFAAKEAFVKAMGTGFSGFELKEIFIVKNDDGKPFIKVLGKAEKILNERCPNPKVHVSLSHEKEYAIAFVVIEKE